MKTLSFELTCRAFDGTSTIVSYSNQENCNPCFWPSQCLGRFKKWYLRYQVFIYMYLFWYLGFRPGLKPFFWHMLSLWHVFHDLDKSLGLSVRNDNAQIELSLARETKDQKRWSLSRGYLTLWCYARYSFHPWSELLKFIPILKLYDPVKCQRRYWLLLVKGISSPGNSPYYWNHRSSPVPCPILIQWAWVVG